MEIDQIVKGKDCFATKKVGDELVLVPIKDNVAEMNAMFTLNDVGTFIWDKIEAGCTKEALSEAMVQEFDIDQATATADLDEFLGQLEAMMNG